MELTLENLGLSREGLAEMVVDQVVQNLLFSASVDDEGREYPHASDFRDKLKTTITETIHAKVREIGDQHLVPTINGMIENLVLQETTKWGEKRGEPVTFTEYMVQRAEAYLHEEVDFHGKTRAESSYSWSKSGTRISWLVHRHLQLAVESAMKKALENANAMIVGGIEGAVKIKLAEVANQLKVQVKV